MCAVLRVCSSYLEMISSPRPRNMPQDSVCQMSSRELAKQMLRSCETSFDVVLLTKHLRRDLLKGFSDVEISADVGLRIWDRPAERIFTNTPAKHILSSYTYLNVMTGCVGEVDGATFFKTVAEASNSYTSSSYTGTFILQPSVGIKNCNSDTGQALWIHITLTVGALVFVQYQGRSCSQSCLEKQSHTEHPLREGEIQARRNCVYGCNNPHIISIRVLTAISLPGSISPPRLSIRACCTHTFYSTDFNTFQRISRIS